MSTYTSSPYLFVGAKPLDEVTVENKLYRHWTEGNYKKWVPLNVPPKKCVFLGYRILSNGHSKCDHDEVITYTIRETLKVALVVVPDGKTNPFYTTAMDTAEEQQCND